jgi:hypothetical protein
MNFLLDALRPSDWEQVRSIYLEGILDTSGGDLP